jgi:hypothetical protein
MKPSFKMPVGRSQRGEGWKTYHKPLVGFTWQARVRIDAYNPGNTSALTGFRVVKPASIFLELEAV